MALSPADLARTIVARASTAQLEWSDPSGMTESALVTAVDLDADLDGPPSVLEIADAAPLPVPGRIRHRLRLHGPAAMIDDIAVIAPREIHVIGIWGSHAITPDEMAAATPDPLAMVESDILSHLDRSHPAFIGALTALIGSDDLDAVVRVWPLALTACGLTLRVQSATGYRDRRISFPSPATSPDEAMLRLQELVSHSRR